MNYSKEDRFYPFEPVPLSYQYNSLNPNISEYTMYFHHDKHYTSYIDKLNALIKPYPMLHNVPLSDLTHDENTEIRNNAGGVYNHELYFQSITPIGTAMSGYVADRLEKNFGSVENFCSEFKKAALAQFGSGYAWLVQCCSFSYDVQPMSRKKLKIIKTNNQDVPNLLTEKIILPIDVWEHAYYLDRQNRRDEYVDCFLNVVNWNIVEDRMKH